VIFSSDTQIVAEDITSCEDILRGWVFYKVDTYLQLLRNHIGEVLDGAQLQSILDGAMYFAMSLGRSGADFRGKRNNSRL
jgi:Dor1-like family